MVRGRRACPGLLLGAQQGHISRSDAGEPLLPEGGIQKLLHLPDVVVPRLLVLLGVRQVVLGCELGEGKVIPRLSSLLRRVLVPRQRCFVLRYPLPGVLERNGWELADVQTLLTTKETVPVLEESSSVLAHPQV